MSIFFDPTYYLQNNPDVLQAVIAGTIPSALYHWETYGWRELRNPNAVFNTSEYFSNNPDVARAGINPLQHFIDFGAAEGRVPNDSFVTRTNFDWQAYLASNPDVAGFANESTPPAWTNWPAGAPWTPQDAAYWQFSLYGFSEHRAGVQTVTGEPINSQGVPYTASAFNLTTAVEILNGTPANDVFTGTFGVSQAADTYQTGDTVNGLGGTNTLNLTALAGSGVPPVASGTAIVKNIQTINVMDTVGSTLNASLIENDPTINFTRTLDGKTSQVTSASLASTVGLQGLGDLTVGYANTSGKADTAKVALTGVGAEGNASVINVSNTNTIEAVTVATTGTNVFDIQGGTKAATVTVTGTGDNTASFSKVASQVTIDASAATGKQAYTVDGLAFGDVIKGGKGTEDTLSTTLTSAATIQPTVSGFETLALDFQAAGTYNANQTTGVNTLDLVAGAATAIRVTNLASTAQTINIGDEAALSTGAVTVNYVSGANSDVTVNVGATNASTDPSVTTGALTIGNNAGALTIHSVGDAANVVADIVAAKASALTVAGIDQALTVSALSGVGNAATVTIDASKQDTTAGALTADQDLTHLVVQSGAGKADLGNIIQTGGTASIDAVYDFTAGAEKLTGHDLTATVTGDAANLSATINATGTGAGELLLGDLSFTGTKATADVALNATSADGKVTIDGLAVSADAAATSNVTLDLSANGGDVKLTSLDLSHTDSLTISVNASGSDVTIGSLAGSDSTLTSITASGNGAIKLFGTALTDTVAIAGDATIDTAGATGGVVINLAKATGSLDIKVGNAGTNLSNVVVAGSGSDTFVGGTGNDKFVGNAGDDNVTLGGGHNEWGFANVFASGTAGDADAVGVAVGIDTINGFVVANDQFVLNESVFGEMGNAVVAQFQSVSGEGATLTVTVATTGAIVFNEADNGIYFVEMGATATTLEAAVTAHDAVQIGVIGSLTGPLAASDFTIAT
ncbi:hypothetical protein V5F69_15080 [Xanthobacter sp. V2C-4]|uniref:beta strand repeat-containing protein n=1 Tax=Xanthobacter albus TaxID=3119929 RepID=UPI003726C9EC